MLLLFFITPAFSQNTKGDAPVRNQRQVRETRLKSIKRKNNSTKDISGHRLRTKNKSSASRANANYPTPTPYAGRKKVKSDRVVRSAPMNATQPGDRQRPWRGDISGKPLRVVAHNKKALRSNPPSRVYTRTASGNLPIRRKPSEHQRAWKGGLDRGPLKNQSATGTVKNTYPQTGPYVRGYRKRPDSKPGSRSNRSFIGLTSRLSKAPSGRRPGAPRSASGNFRRSGGIPQSASGNFIKRGRRNVYWGKFSKGERAITTDLSGRPLRTRNYRSAPAGLVEKFFSIPKRIPGGDRSTRGLSGGFATASKRGQKAWTGDISGHKLRSTNPQRRSETAGKFLFFRKLSVTSGAQKAGRQLPGGGYATRSRQRVGNQPLPPRAPGIGAIGINGQKGNSGFRPGFDTETAGYSGAAKTRRKLKGGGSISGRLWNNNQAPVGVRAPGSIGAGSYQGNLQRGKRSYGGQGEGFSGFIKSRGPKSYPDQGESFSGFTKSRPKGYRDQGEAFSGFAKARRPLKGGGSISGGLRNNNQSPVGVRTPGQGSVAAGSFQGNIQRQNLDRYRSQGEGFSGFIKSRGRRTYPDQGEGFSGFTKSRGPKGYADQGEAFSGFAKARRPLKGGGSISRNLWNNNQTPVGVRAPGQGSIAAGSFQGNTPRQNLDRYRSQGEGFSGFIKSRGPKTYPDQGEGFSGFTKTRRPLKGGGSITTNWNNNELPIEGRAPGSGTIRGGQYAGNIKTKRPEKGGGSITTHWNNNETAIAGRGPGSGTIKAGRYAGNLKVSKPEKGGGSISGKLWNNNEQPIEGRIPGKGAMAVGYSGKIKAGEYVQNPNASKESILKQKPDKSVYQVAGLQVKVREGNYKDKPNAAKGSLPGIAPSGGSVKASEYRGNLKLYWSYKHNPSSADEAQKALYFGKAYARIANYQGNVKMHKYNDKRLHPDAQFAHSFHDNVKGEKTVLMDLKLLWSNVFRKSDTQPENLKEKSERPRYDKGEKGLWADDPSFQKKKQP